MWILTGKVLNVFPCLIVMCDEDLVEEARFGGQRDPVTSDGVHDPGRALVEEGEDGVGVTLLLEVIPQRGVQHLVERVHLGSLGVGGGLRIGENSRLMLSL